MTDTKLRPWKATDLLHEEHEALRQLFLEYEELSPGEHSPRGALFRRIRTALLAHTELEEAVFYPAMDKITRAQDLVTDAHEEHEIMKMLLDQLGNMRLDDFHFDARMKVLIRNVERHIDEEEQELFPLFRKLDVEEQRRLTSELQAQKDEQETRGEEGF